MSSWLLTFLACTENKTATVLERPADFSIRSGVESVSVLDAEPNVPLTLYDVAGTPLVSLVSDELGQAHFAYIPEEYMLLDPNNFEGLDLSNGDVLLAGSGYYIQDDTTDPPSWSGLFTVYDIDDIPDVSFYEGQTLTGTPYSPLTGVTEDPALGFQYIEMRDGTLLSAMVRFPDPNMYGEGPYPTVVEYSGYSPSRPDNPDTGSLLASALGYATVSVNMRGTGCSGGVFDVFNKAQHADGYDIIEVVAHQDWVLNNQVGMVGLSYPGISQLYVASTQPPSLAAIIPLSTIADAWEMQWPGGIYNKGFTRTWVEQREAQAQMGGASWVTDIIESGDAICEDNLKLSAHSVDFETFLRALEMRPKAAIDRDLRELVTHIDSAVFYGGSFQDEQTGAQFGTMLDQFDSARALKIRLTNGRHPDGYAPDVVYRWFEFLELYVAERIPRLNSAVRIAASQFGSRFGLESVSFEEDRFIDYVNYEEALAAYEAEAPVTISFEAGAVSQAVGAPGARFTTTAESWPIENLPTRQWFFAPQGYLSTVTPSQEAAEKWLFDPEASSTNFFGAAGYQLMEPLWDINWTRFAEGYVLAYQTEPFTESEIIAGPAIADLWIKSTEEDVILQASLLEMRPDGSEYLIQTGWLRAGHQAHSLHENLRIQRSYTAEDFTVLPPNEWVRATVELPSFAHPIRAGSALAIQISSPGRNHGTWQFEVPNYTGEPEFQLGLGGAVASSLTISTIPNVNIPEEYPSCPSLRGQPCRETVPVVNRPVE